MDSNGFRNVAISDYLGIASQELGLWARPSFSKRTSNIPSTKEKTTKIIFWQIMPIIRGVRSKGLS
jgi:hypothetical protein